MTLLLYRAAEIEVSDQVPGLGEVKRVVRRPGEVDLYWALMPASFVTLGADTQVLARRSASGVVTVGQASQVRAVPGRPGWRYLT